MADIIERAQEIEHKYGEKIAAWAIILIIAYLIVAQ